MVVIEGMVDEQRNQILIWLAWAHFGAKRPMKGTEHDDPYTLSLLSTLQVDTDIICLHPRPRGITPKAHRRIKKDGALPPTQVACPCLEHAQPTDPTSQHPQRMRF